MYYVTNNLFTNNQDFTDEKDELYIIIIPEKDQLLPIDKALVLHLDRNSSLGKFARFTLPSINEDTATYKIRNGYILFESVDDLCNYLSKL